MIRLPFNFVEYDGNPDMLLEPVSHITTFHQFSGAGSNNYQEVDPFLDGVGLIADFQILDAVYLGGVHEFHWV